MDKAIAEINRLTAERTRLYLMASNGHRGDPAVRSRIEQIDGELDLLWEQRRRERAGRRDGIDLLVHRAYERTYGADYEEEKVLAG